MSVHLTDNSFEPFRKDEGLPVYVNKKSNHPPAILKNLPAMIERRVSSRCSNQTMFDKHKGDYEQALANSGYQAQLRYQDGKQEKKRKPRRKMFWFNPPFSQTVKTNVGKEFLALIEKHFPPGNKWRKHFNRHTIKLSYSTTKNLAAHINQHNKKLLSTDEAKPGCNCRVKTDCPLNGECQTKGVVYLSKVKTDTHDYAYYGGTDRTFKERYYGHTSDMRNDDKPGTALARQIHQLKNSVPPIDYKLEWSIANKCYPLVPGQPVCDVCLTEKTRILLGHKGPPPKLSKNCIILNQRKEIYAKCRHRARFKLENL